MTRVALRSLAARKLRTALTSIAVLLGVAMVAGTLIETDQITNAFDKISSQSVAKLDVVITPEESFSAGFGGEAPTMSERVVERVEAIDGVAGAEGGLTAFGQIVVDGEPVDTFGAPGLVVADGTDAFDPSETVAGRDPTGPGEAALLASNAEDNGLALGDRIGVVTRHGEKQVTIVGLFDFGEAGSLGGTTLIALPPEQVARWFDLTGRVNTVSVIAEDGVAPAELSDRIATELDGGLEVQTADENAEESASEINDQIGAFLTPALLALAGAAVLVGAFIIFNTFSITVAQRMREFAMLRALGATRGQVLAAVAAEALAVGLVASLAGLALGLGFAKLLNALFDAAGFGIPVADLVIAPRTVVAAFAVGIGTTLVAALVPALRAMRADPVAAMSGVPPPPSSRARRSTAIATVVFLIGGLALTIQGLFGSGAATSRLGAISIGAVAVFIGIALSARYVVRPLAAVVGYPIERILGTPGRLARENTVRNPGRTAITSAALMIGLGLVVFVAVFAAGLKSSFAGQIDELVRADMVVYSQDFQTFPGNATRVVDDVEGVESAVGLNFDQLEVNGESSNPIVDLMIGVDPTLLGDVYTFEWIEGDDALLDELGRGETLIEEQFAAEHGVGVGDSYSVETPSGKKTTLTAIGEYRDPTIIQGTISTPQTLATVSPARDPISMLVSADEGTEVAAVQDAVEKALEPYPSLKIESRAEYQDTISGQLDQIVYLLYALLAMCVIISLFGIANSLFLSIHERTGELGILRSIGATTGQLRRVIRYESVITSVIGGLLGTVVGIAFAAIVIASLSEFGLRLSIPVGQLVVFMVVAVAVGVIGAIAPARRVSRIDILHAVSYE
jgi:putative ABC transport system permease protein